MTKEEEKKDRRKDGEEKKPEPEHCQMCGAVILPGEFHDCPIKGF